MELNKKEIGGRIKDFLLSKFRTLVDAAEYLETTAPNISNSYINGKSLPGAEFLSKMLLLGCNLYWLFFGDEKPPQEQVNQNFLAPVNVKNGNLTGLDKSIRIGDNFYNSEKQNELLQKISQLEFDLKTKDMYIAMMEEELKKKNKENISLKIEMDSKSQ